MAQQDNVAFVRDAYARFNAGERTAELWFWHPDGEYHAAREDPDSAVHRGIDALRRHYASWVEAYPDLTIEIVEAEGNGDRVFLWVRFHGHGAASGIPLDMELAHVCTLREGRVVRVVEFTNRGEARRAAGLAK
jgi:ketosteroid isomerase-like protein